MGAARNYTKQTLKKLFALSGNTCAFPGCTKRLVNQKNALDSNICHIEAAEPGGERYNKSMTDKERADYKNLILLCPQHHDETNDIFTYTVDVLMEMKSKHESSCLQEVIKTNPSMLKNAITAISSIDISKPDEPESLCAFDPNDKITYNCIKRNYSFINEYKVYHTKVNSIYNELEFQGSLRKDRLLSNIRQVYLEVKGKYVLDSKKPMDIVRANADNIMDEVYDSLIQKVNGCSLFEEDLVWGVRLVMVDAFIRCKILEEPA